MRVSVYRDLDGEMSVLIEATPGKGRAPVLLRNVTAENVVAGVRPLIDAMRRPKLPKPDPAG